jgi:hypothetical protein
MLSRVSKLLIRHILPSEGAVIMNTSLLLLLFIDDRLAFKVLRLSIPDMRQYSEEEPATFSAHDEIVPKKSFSTTVEMFLVTTI